MRHFIKVILFKLKQYKNIKQLSKVKNVNIQKPFNIPDIENIQFCEDIYIGPESYIMSKGGVKIGSNVIMGPRVTIWTENHNFKSSKMVPYDEYDIPKPVSIGDNVWIGLGSQICPGAKIGDGVVIGMGSVVRGEVPPLAIVFGNPAQIIGYRDEKMYKTIIDNDGIYLKIRRKQGIKRITIECQNYN